MRRFKRTHSQTKFKTTDDREPKKCTDAKEKDVI
jgi:hypothetical protein